MTVISPYQRQLIFTGFGSKTGTRRNKTSLWQKAVSFVSLTKSFTVFTGLVVLCGAGLFFLAVDSVLLSFKIQSLSLEIENDKAAKEKLELKQAALLSPNSLKEYALMVKLENPNSINYQVRN